MCLTISHTTSSHCVAQRIQRSESCGRLQWRPWPALLIMTLTREHGPLMRYRFPRKTIISFCWSTLPFRGLEMESIGCLIKSICSQEGCFDEAGSHNSADCLGTLNLPG